jgi:predicted Zn-dependent protease
MQRLAPIKPLYFVHEDGISRGEVSAVTEAIEEVLRLANATHLIPHANLGTWRQSDWSSQDRSGGAILQPYLSVDWYLAMGRIPSNDGRVRSTSVLQELWDEPWQNGQQHYDVLLTHRDLYADNTHFIIGEGVRGFALILSTFRFQQLRADLCHECLKTVAMHELGHVFGLIPDNRKVNVEYSLGKHCTNRCIMRQGLQIPTDFIRYTEDRLAGIPFCTQCLYDLRRYFTKE